MKVKLFFFSKMYKIVFISLFLPFLPVVRKNWTSAHTKFQINNKHTYYLTDKLKITKYNSTENYEKIEILNNRPKTQIIIRTNTGYFIDKTYFKYLYANFNKLNFQINPTFISFWLLSKNIKNTSICLNKFRSIKL